MRCWLFLTVSLLGNQREVVRGYAVSKILGIKHLMMTWIIEITNVVAITEL